MSEKFLDEIIKAKKSDAKSKRFTKNRKRIQNNFKFKKTRQNAGFAIQKKNNIQKRRQSNVILFYIYYLYI